MWRLELKAGGGNGMKLSYNPPFSFDFKLLLLVEPEEALGPSSGGSHFIAALVSR